jgi:hypothetical protein
MLSFLSRWKWPLVATLFALSVAPTFISYQPYLYEWDDAEYLTRSIGVSQALWSGNVHGLGAMASIRPPMMALLGWPWGRLTNWNAAGDCFVSLAALIAFLAALCLYLLLRIGVKPWSLLAASACVFASLGPYPHATSLIDLNWGVMAAAAHFSATGFLADSLFAWTALAAVLLIPFEARTVSHSTRAAVLSGVLWGLLLSLGVMTKLNFLYFVATILPSLLVITHHRSGLRYAFAALVGFFCSSAPSAFYLARWGRPAFENMRASSFGAVAHYYYIPILEFLSSCIRESPGLLFSFVLIVASLTYSVVKKRNILWSADSLALATMMGFAVIVLTATNKQIRYAFPAIVAVPFLTSILACGKGDPVPVQSARFAAAMAFCGLLALGVPMRSRPDRTTISRSEAVLTKALVCHSQGILLATDSPTFNISLMQLATQMSHSGESMNLESLAWQAADGAPIEEDFRKIGETDQVVFQDRKNLSTAVTNLRAAAYESDVERLGFVPTKVADDVTVYSKRCVRE